MQFLNEVFQLVNNTDLNFIPNMKQFLFGYLDKDAHSPENYLSLHLKKFIWSSKFKSKTLSLLGFKRYFKYILTENKVLCEIRGKKDEFNVWYSLYRIL